MTDANKTTGFLIKAGLVVGMGLMVGVTGCKKDNKPAAAAATPPAQEITAQPQVYIPSTPPPSYSEVTPAPTAEPSITPVTSSGSAPAAGGSITGTTYVVQKGDTLFSIAQRRYGNGGQWKKIVAANPGVKPEKLIPGTKLKLPN